MNRRCIRIFDEEFCRRNYVVRGFKLEQTASFPMAGGPQQADQLRVPSMIRLRHLVLRSAFFIR